MSREKIEQLTLEAQQLKTQFIELTHRDHELTRSISAQKRGKAKVKENKGDIELRIDQESDTIRKDSLNKEMKAIEDTIEEIDSKIVKLEAELKSIKDNIPPIEAEYIAKTAELNVEKLSLKRQEAQEQLAKEQQEQLAKEQQEQLAKENAITTRGILAIELGSILDDYIMKRTERFSLKDKISPADQIARQELIDTIRRQLTDFIATGNPEDVLATIKQGLTDFQGINLPATLNKVAAKLMEAAPTAVASVQYSPAERQAYDTTYAEKLEILKERLKEMYQYGHNLKNPAEKTTVTKLAGDLTAYLDKFQQEHENNIPEPESFKQFSKKFIARLHSEDGVMHKKNSWKAIVANVVAAVFTLGIALGVKLAHSKITEGRAHLFFNQNAGEKTVTQIEESVKSINDTAPGA